MLDDAKLWLRRSGGRRSKHLLKPCRLAPSPARPPNMQVLAHSGGNWTPGALAVQTGTGIIALAVRGTVLLLADDGAFSGEIRGLGRGRVTSLCFCSAPALTHLLAVGTSEGLVRVYDVETRRICRRVRDAQKSKTPDAAAVSALAFIPQCPNLLVIASAARFVQVCRLESDAKVQFMPKVSLTMHIAGLVCVQCIPNHPTKLLVGGQMPNSEGAASCHGVLLTIDLQTRAVVSTIEYADGVVHSMSMRRGVSTGAIADTAPEVAVVSGSTGVPTLFQFRGTEWHSQSSTQHAPLNVKKRKISHNAAQGRDGNQVSAGRTPYTASLTWISEHLVMCSDATGAISLWHSAVFESGLVKVFERPDAHKRQVFAIVPRAQDKGFISFSMDRRTRVWSMAPPKRDGDLPNRLCLNWESIGTGGAVQSICLRGDSENWEAKEASISLGLAPTVSSTLGVGCGDGTLSVWLLSHKFPSLLKRMFVESVIHGGGGTVTGVATLRAVALDVSQSLPGNGIVFGTSDGRLGIAVSADEPSDFRVLIATPPRRKASGRDTPRRIIAVSAGSLGTALSLDDSGRIRAWNLSQNSAQSGQNDTCFRATPTPKRTVAEAIPDMDIITAFGELDLGSCDTGKQMLVLGDRRGNIAATTANAKGSVSVSYVLHANDTQCSSITCLSFCSGRSILGAADVKGSIVTVRVDIVDDKTTDDDSVVLTVLCFIRSAHAQLVTSISWGVRRCSNSDTASSCDEMLASTGGAGSAVVWVCDASGQITKRAELRGHVGRVLCSVWVTPHTIVTGGEDGTIREWDVDKQPTPKLQR